jgi:hypothetical protein
VRIQFKNIPDRIYDYIGGNVFSLVGTDDDADDIYAYEGIIHESLNNDKSNFVRYV